MSPNPVGAIDLHVGLPDALDLWHEGIVALRSAPVARAVEVTKVPACKAKGGSSLYDLTQFFLASMPTIQSSSCDAHGNLGIDASIKAALQVPCIQIGRHRRDSLFHEELDV